MIAILKKEINTFFDSATGYLAIGIFLLVNGLFLWVFKSDYNLLDNGFADLSVYFNFVPWVFLFLIPAVCMRMFSEEKRQGTLELLLTKPISHNALYFGKFLAAFILIFIALAPTLIYAYSLHVLGNPVGNLDLGTVAGSFLGLLFMAGSYIAIALFGSSLSSNQIVAFMISVVISLFMFIGFDGIADFTASGIIEQAGMRYHFQSIAQGVIDTRDVIYFISVALIFALLAQIKIGKQESLSPYYKRIIIFLVVIIGINLLGRSFYQRFDITEDRRYSLSEASREIATSANEPLIVDVFLEGSGFPSEFRRLQSETKQLLEEYSALNPNIKFSFINPIEDDENRDLNIRRLAQRGLTPMQLSVQQDGKTSQEVIFPWALASYGEFSVKIPLIKNKIGSSQEELVQNSVQQLEYAFSDGFSKLLNPKRRKIAVLKGNGQLENRYIADFVKTIRDYYFVAPFTLDSVATSPQRTLDSLKTFDLIINAKPTEAFSEEENYLLDQYIMSGGKSLWLLDQVAIDEDSLMQGSGEALATGRELNLRSLLFKYGLRVNPVLVQDLYSAPITLASGEGSQARFNQLPWFYYPLLNSNESHPISKNINLVKFNFANQIDTLKNAIRKTVLLQTSELSRVQGVPIRVSLNLATQEPDPKLYASGGQNLAVLLEGEFNSAYSNRVKPIDFSAELNKSVENKMIVIADGDLIRNELGSEGVLELGFDRWTGELYGNKEFLLNAVNYLLDDSGLINIRSKQVSIAFLDPQKVTEERVRWQLINVALPLVLLFIFGWVFNYLRRRKYAR